MTSNFLLLRLFALFFVIVIVVFSITSTQSPSTEKIDRSVQYFVDDGAKEKEMEKKVEMEKEIQKEHEQHIDMFPKGLDCKNGGIEIFGECHCPSFVYGHLCEDAGECYNITKKISYAYVWGLKPQKKVKSCTIDPHLIPCWLNSTRAEHPDLAEEALFARMNDTERAVVAESDNLTKVNVTKEFVMEDEIERLLKTYGPWNKSDKLFLKTINEYWSTGSPPVDYRNTVLTPVPPTPDNQPVRLAYVLMIHKSYKGDRFERLFKMIYRPYNYYMIHIDADGNEGERQWLIKYSKKFLAEVNYKTTRMSGKRVDNIYFMKNRIKSEWGDITLVYQNLLAFVDLLKINRKVPENERWQHAVSLSVFDLPVKKISEIEAYLRPRRNQNFIQIYPELKYRSERAEKLHLQCDSKIDVVQIQDSLGIMSRDNKKFPNPFYYPNVWKRYESSQWTMVTPEFADYMVRSPWALEVLFGAKYDCIPDESYFASVMTSSPFYKQDKDTFMYPSSLRHPAHVVGADTNVTEKAFKDLMMPESPFLYARKFRSSRTAKMVEERIYEPWYWL
eukprot:TRINITY_DN2351_c0_g1_i7.p1 TRINITY_DN2351_c0_g1~~TRINITY_DN2351_c0_g1_i7.p1  ORF type:complete len:571 (+),score=81.47 TRINITY_DN2351_c0_g1_i7:35-1714(+)